MGSCCSFHPSNPHLLASCSKGGQLLLLDLRQLQAPLVQQQLQGPIFDCCWWSGGQTQDLLLTVGKDSCLRGYNPLNLNIDTNQLNGALPVPLASSKGQAGDSAVAPASNSVSHVVNMGQGSELTGQSSGQTSAVEVGEVVVDGGNNQPQARGVVKPDFELWMGAGYRGQLLTVSTTADGTGLAVAGSAVPVSSLVAEQANARPQQHQQQQQAQKPKTRGTTTAAAVAGQEGGSPPSMSSLHLSNADGPPTAPAGTAAAAHALKPAAAGVIAPPRRRGGRRAGRPGASVPINLTQLATGKSLGYAQD